MQFWSLKNMLISEFRTIFLLALIVGGFIFIINFCIVDHVNF